MSTTKKSPSLTIISTSNIITPKEKAAASTAKAAPTQPSVETVKEWHRRSVTLLVKSKEDRREAIFLMVKVGWQLIAHNGEHGYRVSLGLTKRQVGRCRAFAVAWGTHDPSGRTHPVGWDKLNLDEIEKLGAKEPGTGPQSGGGNASRSEAFAPAPPVKPEPVATDADMFTLDYGTDVLDGLRKLKEHSIDCVVTSPPYFRIRDYGVEGQGGREESPDEHIDWLVKVFREIKRVLKPLGTVWVNYDDVSAAAAGTPGVYNRFGPNEGRLDTRGMGVPDKALLGMQHRFVLAMIEDGWLLRNEVIWVKPNPRKRPGWTHRLDHAWEPVFCFVLDWSAHMTEDRDLQMIGDVWTDIPAAGQEKDQFIDPRKHHEAPFSVALAERCILLGCPKRGVVLDLFSGSGSTGVASVKNGRSYVGIELNDQNSAVAIHRIVVADDVLDIVEGATWLEVKVGGAK